MLNDLGSNGNQVAFLVGETVNADVGGACSLHNNVIVNIPNVIPNNYIIKPNDLAHKGDGLHFTSESNRIFGKRYAEVMLNNLRGQGN